MTRRYSRILAVVCCGCLAAAAATLFLWINPPAFVPGYQKVKMAHTTSEARLLDRHGEIIHELRVDSIGRRLEWTPLAEVSPALQAAILCAEDHRYYSHRGVDWISLAGAASGALHGSTARGASTITMQLVSRLAPELRPHSFRRSLFQKVKQIRTAREIERRWSKGEILEAYLNLVTFRGELEGIAAAAAGLFGKKPHGLNDAESVILAALVRSPNASAEQVGTRAVALARAMSLPVNAVDIAALSQLTLSRPYYVPPAAALAPHVAQQVLRPALHGPAGPDARVVCTLDAGLQRFAADALRHQLMQLRPQNVRDGAVLAVENQSGDVLAYVGNDGDRASARFVDGVRAPRQAGSTLKPFVYGIAFERRQLTPVSLLDDSPLDIPVGGGIYRPRNYDKHFHGMVTSRTALASSLNVPAVRVISLVGIDPVIERLEAFGFHNLQYSDFYGPSLALGAVDITLWDLVNAYRALANGGVWSTLRLTPNPSSPRSRRVLSPEAAFLLQDILSDRESRSVTFSLESPLSTRFWTAVKTGTSKDMRDNWCVGFSQRYTVGVWTGNFSGQPMWDVSGITGAAPIWVETMNWLHQGESSAVPAPPSGVSRRTVQMAFSGRRSQEWFVRGTETDLVEPAVRKARIRIAYPASGTVMALDPDIPDEDQKVLLEAEPAGSPLDWLLDDQRLGSSASPLLWTPSMGKHTLSLVDASGRTLDAVEFEVRGSLPPSRNR